MAYFLDGMILKNSRITKKKNKTCKKLCVSFMELENYK